MAHALDLVGERWTMLIVRELMRGPSDTPTSSTAFRHRDQRPGGPARDLESNGIVTRCTSAPAASRVYELTEYGRDLRPAMRELALWGARSLGPPSAGPCSSMAGSWNAMDIVLAPLAPPGRFEFRVGDEVASMVDGEVRHGSIRIRTWLWRRTPTRSTTCSSSAGSTT